jgi:hypothetical protein
LFQYQKDFTLPAVRKVFQEAITAAREERLENGAGVELDMAGDMRF